MYVYDKKTFSSLHRRGRREKGELKMQATPTMLLKTNGGKTSAGATPTMFMKTSNLSLHTYDVDENKGSCEPGSTAPGS
jgi:hypothetical protein